MWDLRHSYVCVICKTHAYVRSFIQIYIRTYLHTNYQTPFPLDIFSNEITLVVSMNSINAYIVREKERRVLASVNPN